MPLSVNNEIIDDRLIAEEANRLHAEYVKMFPGQDLETKTATLIEWAKENIVENVLLRQYIKKNGIDYKPRPDLSVDQVIWQELKDSPLAVNTDRVPKTLDEFVDTLKQQAVITFKMNSALTYLVSARLRACGLQSGKRLTYILVKPAGPECNMACGYCFYLEKKQIFPRSATCRMPDDVLQAMTIQALAPTNREITFGWQGGEPTLMGLSFFEKALSLQHKYGKGHDINNCLQTNGLLIDKNWTRFLKRNAFLTGISLDGPEHIHDHYRKKKDGRGTWRQVVKSAQLLLHEAIDTNVLSVVTDYAAKFPEEIYRFHKEHGLTFMQFVPCAETDKQNPGKMAPFSVNPVEYGDFLCALFDLWVDDFAGNQPTTSIRYFDSVFHTYLNKSAPDCAFSEECGTYLVVEHNGDVFPCDFFVEAGHKIGNVLTDDLINMFNSDEQDRFSKKKTDLPASCRTCPWLEHCRGGCPKYATKSKENRHQNYFCPSYTIFFEHAHNTLLSLADKWRSGVLEHSCRNMAKISLET